MLDVNCSEIALMLYADNLGPDQPVHSHSLSLIWDFVNHLSDSLSSVENIR